MAFAFLSVSHANTKKTTEAGGPRAHAGQHVGGAAAAVRRERSIAAASRHPSRRAESEPAAVVSTREAGMCVSICLQSSVEFPIIQMMYIHYQFTTAVKRLSWHDDDETKRPTRKLRQQKRLPLHRSSGCL